MLDAIDKKDVARLESIGSDLDAVCESCHLTFWYPPSQARLISKPPGFRQFVHITWRTRTARDGTTAGEAESAAEGARQSAADRLEPADLAPGRAAPAAGP